MTEIPAKDPPHHPEAEKYILGCMLLGDKIAVAKGLEKLQPEDFYYPAHRVIFSAVQELFKDGKPIDWVNCTEVLRAKNLLDSAGGEAYLMDLMDIQPLPTNVEYYLGQILEKSCRRNLIEIAYRIADLSYQQDQDLDAIINSAQSEIYRIILSEKTRELLDANSILVDVFNRVYEAYHARRSGRWEPGYPSTGFSELDEFIGGFRPTDLVVLAARPSKGKTSLALNFAFSVALRSPHHPVAFFSLEMSPHQLGLRLLSLLSHIDSQNLAFGRLSDEEWARLGRCIGELTDLPIYIDSTPILTPLEIKGKCRRLKMEKGLSLVIIDYLQLMEGKRKWDNRVQEVAEITRSLKMMAKELDLCVLAVSQLSRDIEKRPGKRPLLSDLKESGAIEQDADIVMFIYSEDSEELNEGFPDTSFPVVSENNVPVELIIAKNRHGKTGKISLIFRRNINRFALPAPE
ncbi:MAG: replicative DNA helicase [bacterium JZ-2024 1]